jgi:hypothetical protein
MAAVANMPAFCQASLGVAYDFYRCLDENGYVLSDPSVVFPENAVLAECCGRSWDNNACRDLDYQCLQGYEMAELLDPLSSGNSDCMYYCRAIGAGTGDCPSTQVVNYEICVEETSNGFESGVVAEDIKARAACCSGSQNADLRPCRELKGYCDGLEKNASIVDAYGAPIEGLLLDVLKEACKTRGPQEEAGLSGGAIAGIVTAVVVVVGGVAGVLVYLIVLRKKESGSGDDKAAA